MRSTHKRWLQISFAGCNISAMIIGLNAVAVERQEVHKGVTSNHLTVFEFRADKVSRIIEYWK